jgi:putative transposase
MKKGQFSEEQIIQILKESEAGVATGELCRQHGISPATFYKWKSKYRGMDVPDVKKMRHLEDENSKLKRMVADQALDIQALKLVISKKF